MQDSREHAATCLNRLSATVAELGRALVRDTQAYPRVYMVELENATSHIAAAQEALLSAKIEARRVVDLQKPRTD